jgi:hypothetical protein
MDNSIIKNNNQLFFNQVKGKIVEINKDENFSNIVLEVGHENCRNVCFISKTHLFENLIKDIEINDKVSVRYYLSSRKKHDRWYTTATILQIFKDNN